MATARANTSISPIRCPNRSSGCARRSIPPLAEVANRWNGQLGRDKRFPPTLKAWLGECHAGGQKRPTPLLLRYGPGDYNCLHRDLYGDLVFPLQATILLSDPGRDFDGGEFMLVEQRPAHAVARRGRPAAAGRRRGLRRQRAAGAGNARLSSHGDAPRRLEPARAASASPSASSSTTLRSPCYLAQRDGEDLGPEFGDAEAGLAAGRQDLGMGGAMLARDCFGRRRWRAESRPAGAGRSWSG